MATSIVLVAMLVFGLFTHMACGATYSLVPFVNRNALGGVAGIVGAGGNVGAVAAGFLVKGVGSIEYALTVLGGIVVASALCALAVRFTQEQKLEERRRYNDALAQKATQAEAIRLRGSSTLAPGLRARATTISRFWY